MTCTCTCRPQHFDSSRVHVHFMEYFLGVSPGGSRVMRWNLVQHWPITAIGGWYEKLARSFIWLLLTVLYSCISKLWRNHIISGINYHHCATKQLDLSEPPGANWKKLSNCSTAQASMYIPPSLVPRPSCLKKKKMGRPGSEAMYIPLKAEET